MTESISSCALRWTSGLRTIARKNVWIADTVYGSASKSILRHRSNVTDRVCTSEIQSGWKLLHGWHRIARVLLYESGGHRRRCVSFVLHHFHQPKVTHQATSPNTYHSGLCRRKWCVNHVLHDRPPLFRLLLEASAGEPPWYVLDCLPKPPSAQLDGKDRYARMGTMSNMLPLRLDPSMTECSACSASATKGSFCCCTSMPYAMRKITCPAMLRPRLTSHSSSQC
jgi:hypothetical protein